MLDRHALRLDLIVRTRLCHRFAIAIVTTIALLLVGCASTPPASITQADATNDVIYRHGAVAADHEVASKAGLEMLHNGGNAVDAAVATSFCLSVVRPFSCGIGGGGFMVIHAPARNGQAARAIALNYRETCPAAVGPEFYESLTDRTASKHGYKASGVPGTVAGLCHALKNFGTLDLPTVIAPAIRAAEDGFVADQAFVDAAQSIAADIADRPDLRASLGTIWSDLCKQGQVQVGDVIRNPDQAKALRLIAQHGPTAMYQGEIATAIHSMMREHGGTLTLSDLAGYQVREVQPLHGTFRGHDILAMPPPSSGGVTMLQTLGMVEELFADTGFLIPNSADYVHRVAEAMKHAFADRSRWLADPEFTRLPLDALLNETYLRERARSINLLKTSQPDTYGIASLPEDGGTSHFSVIDASGMAVACTETINLTFGSLVCVPGFGFCLNNEMDDFTTQRGAANAFGLRQSDANLPEPGKRPLSSMSPTIVLRDGKAVLIAGGSGGPRIISATMQSLLNAMMFHRTPEQAVSAPRFHHQWMPNRLLLDKRWTDETAMDDLKRRGHDIGVLGSEAVVQMIAVDANGNIRAACDPRKGGKPAGY